MTYEEACNQLGPDAYVVVVNGPNHEKIADIVCDMCGTVCAHYDEGSVIKSNRQVEKKITWSEGELENTCCEIRDAHHVACWPDDFEF